MGIVPEPSWNAVTMVNVLVEAMGLTFGEPSAAAAPAAATTMHSATAEYDDDLAAACLPSGLLEEHSNAENSNAVWGTNGMLGGALEPESPACQAAADGAAADDADAFLPSGLLDEPSNAEKSKVVWCTYVDADWTCRACGQQKVFGSRQSCFRCGAARPISSPLSADRMRSHDEKDRRHDGLRRDGRRWLDRRQEDSRCDRDEWRDPSRDEWRDREGDRRDDRRDRDGDRRDYRRDGDRRDYRRHGDRRESDRRDYRRDGDRRESDRRDDWGRDGRSHGDHPAWRVPAGTRQSAPRKWGQPASANTDGTKSHAVYAARAFSYANPDGSVRKEEAPPPSSQDNNGLLPHQKPRAGILPLDHPSRKPVKASPWKLDPMMYRASSS